MEVSSQLTKHLKPEDRKKYIDGYKDAKWILAPIKLELERRYKDLVDADERDSLYESPNMLPKLAANRGGRKVIKEILKLFP